MEKYINIYHVFIDLYEFSLFVASRTRMRSYFMKFISQKLLFDFPLKIEKNFSTDVYTDKEEINNCF
jgi:hypothetical protein